MTLRLPVRGKQFTVATDASDFGIGAVLRQDDGVVEYASRVLTPTEQKYSTIEKECLAIVWAVDKWRPYLLGQPFHIETDHKPLQWLKTARDPRGKLSRWTLRLQEYDFTIGHIPGSRNVIADYLSRPCEDTSLPEVACGVNRVQTDLERLLRCQKADPSLGR
uniref:Clone ZZD180 mRNA sequence n=1 Tax=Schistosoma japonicum TaxID=6182 RepID=Q86EM8_SCHJA|nr:similar to GenBank Accession Number P04323 retrovirus-related pol polyprotein - fruit fly [Schistosoma japonicum]